MFNQLQHYPHPFEIIFCSSFLVDDICSIFSGCNKGFYGRNCSKRCSQKCAGPSKVCDMKYGRCLNGCVPGYRGDKCNSGCANKTYGLNCSQSCSPHCAGPDKDSTWSRSIFTLLIAVAILCGTFTLLCLLMMIKTLENRQRAQSEESTESVESSETSVSAFEMFEMSVSEAIPTISERSFRTMYRSDRTSESGRSTQPTTTT
ncbi:hypothetical protein RRG08_050336 [Elysia crispata]|uniref:Scavenger receptor class F member 2 n=1 Tax=Elysia crispata TaxID=231223 RepID=A0AAE0ZYN3_9GAST|nr:hypothetical protein RRG08_050336 [Elysia crispata]